MERAVNRVDSVGVIPEVTYETRTDYAVDANVLHLWRDKNFS